MPIDTHLNWMEQSDFTPGLWDISNPTQLLSKQQAFSTLTDYEPQAEGGLRAFYLGTTIANTGMDSLTTEIPKGIFVRTGSGSSSPQFDQHLATMGADFKTRWYRFDESNGDTTWNKKKTYTAAASAAFEFDEFCEFRISADDTIRILHCNRDLGADAGNWAMTDSSGAVSTVNAYNGPILVSQARVMYCHGGKIHYSDEGKLTIADPNANVLEVAPNQPNGGIGILSERDPADLLVGTLAAPWYEINGDITNANTPVRALNRDHVQRTHKQIACRIPGGIAFIEPGGRIYKTEGVSFQSLSDAIERFDINVGSGSGPGNVAFLNDYLFAPEGRVYDFRTGAWFQTSLLTNSAIHFSVATGRVYLVSATAPAVVKLLRIYEGGDATVSRVSSGVIQTVPYADKGGRNVRCRELQVFVKNYAASSFTASIIGADDSVLASDTISADPAGRHLLKFMFPNVQDDYLSIKLTTAADNGTSEAPTIERWRIGWGQNNLIGNSAE